MDKYELKKYIGRRIKDEREKRGWGQKELGDRVGVKFNTISSWESGTTSPHQNYLFKIAAAFEIDVDDLFPERSSSELKFLERVKDLDEANLDVNEMLFLQELIEKTLSKKGKEREKFLESIKFTVDYYEKINNKN